MGIDDYRPCKGSECDAGAAEVGSETGADASTCSIPVQPGHCCPDTPFNDPIQLRDPFTSNYDGDLRFAGDPTAGALAVFRSIRGGGQGREDVWTTMITGNAFPPTFSAPNNLTAVNSANAEFSPAISPDGNTLIFSSDRGPQGYNHFHLYISTKQSGTFTTPIPIANVSSPTDVPNDIDPSLVEVNGVLVLYFASERIGGAGNYNLLRTQRLNGTWSTPAGIPALNYGANWTNLAAVTPDERVMYFHSNRASLGSIYVATATTPGGNFDSFRLVNELNLVSQEQKPAYVTADGCTLYFTRAQDPPGTAQIWVATKSP